MKNIEVKLRDLEPILDALRREPRSESKPFGRFHEFGVVLFGFLVSGVAGALLTDHFQTQASKRDHAAIRVRAEIDSANNLFKTTAEITSKRLRMATLLANAYTPDAAERDSELPDRRKDYRAVLDEWNIGRDYRRAQIKNLFGAHAYQFERNIHYAFRHIGQELDALRKASTIVDPNTVSDHLHRLQNEIQGFYFKLSDALATGKVGTFKDVTPANELPWETNEDAAFKEFLDLSKR